MALLCSFLDFLSSPAGQQHCVVITVSIGGYGMVKLRSGEGESVGFFSGACDDDRSVNPRGW
jgi:hypothetical protein